MTPSEYLNAVKEALNTPSDYALAKALEIPTQRVSDWYAGRREINEEGVVKIAITLKLPLGEVLADLRSQEAKTEKAKEFWAGFLSRIRSGGLIALLLMHSVFCGPGLSGFDGGLGRFRTRQMA